VTYDTYGDLELPGTVSGLSSYASAVTYTALSQPEQVTLGTGSDANVTDSYDPRTGNLTGQLVTNAANADLDDTTYAYSPAGALTSETDERNGSASQEETQCFAYTPQGQLSQAWTATDKCAATPTQSSYSTVGDALGTASEYDESWTFNALGEPVTKDALAPSAGTFADTSYKYTDSTELTSAATTGAATSSYSYAYNADGQQQTRNAAAGNQSLSWNGQGQLTSVAPAAGGSATASYVYGPDGSLFSQTNGTATTLYLPGEQITINTSGNTLSGVWYYSLPGGITAVRTGSGNAYGFEIASDQHGTHTLYLDYTAQNPTWRQFDPYGNSRGTAAAAGTFPGNTAFIGDPDDTSTGLANIGARWYDAATGMFASLDPVLQAGSPMQLNGYTYAAGNPVDSSDPTGLTCSPMDGYSDAQCWSKSHKGYCTENPSVCQSQANDESSGNYGSGPSGGGGGGGDKADLNIVAGAVGSIVNFLGQAPVRRARRGGHPWRDRAGPA
jgi:RHS repeat-associated protein